MNCLINLISSVSLVLFHFLSNLSCLCFLSHHFLPGLDLIVFEIDGTWIYILLLHLFQMCFLFLFFIDFILPLNFHLRYYLLFKILIQCLICLPFLQLSLSLSLCPSLPLLFWNFCCLYIRNINWFHPLFSNTILVSPFTPENESHDYSTFL